MKTIAATMESLEPEERVLRRTRISMLVRRVRRNPTAGQAASFARAPLSGFRADRRRS